MGITININGKRTELSSYSVREDSTPLAGNDSSGSVGTIGVDVPHFRGDQILLNKTIEIIDTENGYTLGNIKQVSPSYSSQINGVDADSRLGLLNIEYQVQPFTGRIEDAVKYYLQLGGINEDVLVHPDIADTIIDVPGWFGNLWVGMKQFAAGIECEFALVSGDIVFRPVRLRTARQGRDIDRSIQADATQLARSIEIYYYNNDYKVNSLVYPVGGWSPEVAPLTVPAGEYIEHKLEISTSLDYVKQPTCVTSVAQTYDADSVFTVVGSDGLPITPAQWAAYGGKVEVEIGEDTKSLIVKITGPSGLIQNNGEPQRQFSLAQASGTSTNQTYSTLRLIGDGVHFDKQLLKVYTGVEPVRTSEEIGATIDNPFISTLEQAYATGMRAARLYTGRSIKLDGSVSSINNIGDTGVFAAQTYADVELEYVGQTYGDVGTYIIGAYDTYDNFQQFTSTAGGDNPNVANQTFGNVAGARIYDYESGRWYRIRSTTITQDSISFSADDDLMLSDVDTSFAGLTFGQVDTLYSGYDYFDGDLLGVSLAT